jgi:mannose-6-phosphate isomerase-like protein (cupin superfamily)
MPLVFVENIEELTQTNNDYRNVLYTSADQKMQLVLMSLKPKEEIGREVHENIDQFFRIEKGNGLLVYGNSNKKREIKENDAIIIPSGTYHNIINTSNTKDLKLYTLYTPKAHKDQLKQKFKPQNHD